MGEEEIGCDAEPSRRRGAGFGLDRRGSEFGGDAFQLLVQVQCRNIREKKVLADKIGKLFAGLAQGCIWACESNRVQLDRIFSFLYPLIFSKIYGPEKICKSIHLVVLVKAAHVRGASGILLCATAVGVQYSSRFSNFFIFFV
jgi:hypothetical protein